MHCAADVPISSGEEKVRSPVGLCLNLPFAMDADCACGGGKPCSSCFGAWGWPPLGSRHGGLALLAGECRVAWIWGPNRPGSRRQPDRRGRYESPLTLVVVESEFVSYRHVALTARNLTFSFHRTWIRELRYQIFMRLLIVNTN